VINKWFSVQAAHANAQAALKLMAHADFSWTNPNRLRSVVSVFAGGNLRAFHAADGSGYEFVGDAVLKVRILAPLPPFFPFRVPEPRDFF
jgi:aminopeptidase N